MVRLLYDYTYTALFECYEYPYTITGRGWQVVDDKLDMESIKTLIETKIMENSRPNADDIEDFTNRDYDHIIRETIKLHNVREATKWSVLETL